MLTERLTKKNTEDELRNREEFTSYVYFNRNEINT